MDTTRLELGRRVAMAIRRENGPDGEHVVWSRAKNAFDIARARRRIADGEEHVSQGLAQGILGPGPKEVRTA